MVDKDREREREREREQLEERIASKLKGGDVPEAAAELVGGYGKELYKFLYRMLRESDAADEAFSMFKTNMMLGLPAFRGDASFRTWAYEIARNAAHRLRRDEQRRRKRIVAGADEAVENVEWKPRSATNIAKLTAAKKSVHVLMEQLDDAERELLTLRIQGLSYAEMARIIEGHTVDGRELKSAEVRLRKRVGRAVEHLRELVVAAGLPEKLVPDLL